MTKERIFLIDGMALAYRAYYTFVKRPLINSKGMNTSAIYGFVTFLNRIITHEKPDHIAVVLDTGKPTFRHTQYKDYKATRQKMPEDMATQLPLLRQVIEAYNIPILEIDGYEADDVVGTLARAAEQTGAHTFLVTPDKDFIQLITDKVSLYKPGRQGTEIEIIDVDVVRSLYGIEPHQIIDVFALTGDSSDNIPGVPGIGEKTALPLIRRYSSLENLYTNIENIEPPKLREKLQTYRDQAFLSKQLVTINTNVPLPIDVHSLKAQEKNIDILLQIFEELEFRSFIGALKKEVSQSIPIGTTEIHSLANDQHQYTLIETIEAFQAFLQHLHSVQEFVFDTETTSTNPFKADLLGISFSTEQRRAWYVAVHLSDPQNSPTLFSSPSSSERRGVPLDFFISSLKCVFENPTPRKIGHNIKYDILVLKHYGVEVRGISFDTMLASYLLRPDGRHSLDVLAQEHLHYKMFSYKELTGSGKDQKQLIEISNTKVAEYSCEDADITYRLYKHLKQKLIEYDMVKLFDEIEIPLISVLATMETTGVAIDVPYLESMSKELDRQLTSITQDIYRLAGSPFNLNSSQQLATILFSTLNLQPKKKTKTGFSTASEVLESLRDEHPIVDKILSYRQLSKLKSTYVDALPKLINPQTGRVHTSFNQAVTATGRLSSSEPNLQNIPIRTDIGKAIRKAFIPRSPNARILSADYSQIELRIMAHISSDEELRKAFHSGEDIHASTAAKLFGVRMDEVTREMRRKAKEVNFGIMYGIGPYGLATRLNISQTEAKEIIDRYFNRFPKVQQYIKDTIATARERGFVSTLLGRRRFLPDITSRNQTVRQNAERQAINMPIQGTAADMIKIAMINIDQAFANHHLSARMILQVHDELVFDVPEQEVEQVQKLVVNLMEKALPLSVPIVVETGIGTNWLEAH
ncbi:MAG: DNA polymerase I [Bacteroidetes bacterium]|nr:DNA polymerase I [Bacteroidota bacterium]